MGKLLLAFLFYIASALLAVHEARPPAPPPLTSPIGPPRVDRVNVVETADPTRFAPPLYIRPLPPPLPMATSQPPVITLERVVVHEDNDSNGDVPDPSDKCPLVDGERYLTDEDGCPEPAPSVDGPRRVIVLDVID